jgi:hypothetical protein
MVGIPIHNRGDIVTILLGNHKGSIKADTGKGLKTRPLSSGCRGFVFEPGKFMPGRNKVQRPEWLASLLPCDKDER